MSHRLNMLMPKATSAVALRHRLCRESQPHHLSEVAAAQSFSLAPPTAGKTLAHCLRFIQLTDGDIGNLSSHTAMRWIIAISLALAAVGIFALSINLPGMASELTGPFTQWRHTADGWEKVSSLTERISERICGSLAPTNVPHPVIVSLFTGLLSTLSLVAFTPAKQTPPKTPKKRNGGPIKMPLGYCNWFDNPRLN
jgi:hypothetical protein